MGRLTAIIAAALFAAACGGAGESEVIEPHAEGAASAPAEDSPADEGAGAEAGAEGDEDAPAGPSAESTTYAVHLTAEGPYTVGQEGAFEVRLAGRGEYHVNQEYPTRVSFTAPDAVQGVPETLARDAAAEFSEERAVFRVPFTGTEAGDHEVRAHVRFSVCSASSCLMEEAHLAAALPVGEGGDEAAPDPS